MRDPRRDLQRDLDIRGGGLLGEAYGVVEEDLVRADLDDQGRQARRSAKTGLIRPRAGSSPAV